MTEALLAKEALALAAITMIDSDGSVEEAELRVVNRILDGNHQMFMLAHDKYKELGLEKSVDAVCDSLTPDQLLFALANFLDLMMADGVLCKQEEELLDRYLSNPKVNPTDAEKIKSVLQIKNDRSVFGEPSF